MPQKRPGEAPGTPVISQAAHHACALAVTNLWVEPGQCSEDSAQAGNPDAVHIGEAGIAGHGTEQVLFDLSDPHTTPKDLV